jgi:two-component system phosphate regulon sensor histidine kinase PhoR
VKKVKQHWIVLAIALTMVLTLGTQYYWNAIHFEENRVRVLQDIQEDLDQAVMNYYQRTSAAFSYTLIDTRSEEEQKKNQLAMYELVQMDSMSRYFGDKQNHKMGEYDLGLKEAIVDLEGFTLVRGKTILETRPDLKQFTNRMSWTVHSDSIPLFVLEREVDKQQTEGKFDYTYQLSYYKKDSLIVQSEPIEVEEELISQSKFLPENDHIELGVNLPPNSLFKKGLLGIVLSVILSATVLFCLLYLLRTIARQKKISEIKDDFIGNLTHEFKTPIATASAALQALNQTETAKEDSLLQRYTGIAQGQLDRLNQMVEKLLETASLHAEEVQLAKEEVMVVDYNKDWLERLKERKPQGSLLLQFEEGLSSYSLDRFHFENALSNIIENAFKYGKPPVQVAFSAKGKSLCITITDQGKGIPKEEQDRIFEKFYRIPSGNRHDVKGHGIGLYYAKTIIEKHQGQLRYSGDEQTTQFEILLP